MPPKFFIAPLALIFPIACFCQYKPTGHKKPEGGIVPVSGPGNYGESGKTYMLINDISSPQTPIFLGKDITLDLNGYTIRYADGNYNHIPNRGFENGTEGWDLSKAPGAEVVSTEKVHVFIGKNILSLKKGDEVTSSYVHLPVANRSYFAMCGVTGSDYHAMHGDLANQMKISIFVEDEQGKELNVKTKYEDTTMVSCPLIKEAPRLGGGFLYAHLNKLPAGKYRIRVRAETDCLIDEVDIRPAMDAGIGIVEKTSAKGSYYHLYNCGNETAFFDYTTNIEKGLPVDGVPLANGTGTITIKNGVIENATEAILSWGIQSTAPNIRIILDNIKIKTTGINCEALEIPQATIVNCRFEVENPFVINRHCSFSAVNIVGRDPSEISFSEFIGGQGCLITKGKETNIHHNYFVNRQTVTNHYSIASNGDGTRIFANTIEPDMGSGVWPSQHCEIFDNVIRIKTSPPTCEYGHEEYSTNAIRMADYHRRPGTPGGTFGNKVYNNKIYITANDYPNAHPDYVPMSFAIFYSVAGGEDDVFGNDIIVEKPNPTSKTIAAGLYICGGPESLGGNFYNNRITSNVPAIWVASIYGGAGNTKIYKNTMIRSANALPGYQPVRMGWVSARDTFQAVNVQLRSNEVEGAPFGIQIAGHNNSYSVSWTLTVKVSDKNSIPVQGREVKIRDNNKQLVATQSTDESGTIKKELLQYRANGNTKQFSTPYTIVVGKEKKLVTLTGNTEIQFRQKK